MIFHTKVELRFELKNKYFSFKNLTIVGTIVFLTRRSTAAVNDHLQYGVYSFEMHHTSVTAYFLLWSV